MHSYALIQLPNKSYLDVYLQDLAQGAQKGVEEATEEAVQVDNDAVDLVDEGALVGAKEAGDEVEDGGQDRVQHLEDVGQVVLELLLEFCGNC